MTERLPLFEIATEPLEELEEVQHAVPIAQRLEDFKPLGWVGEASGGRFIPWDEVKEKFGYEPEQFVQAEDTMSPVEEEYDDGSPEQLMHDGQ